MVVGLVLAWRELQSEVCTYMTHSLVFQWISVNAQDNRYAHKRLLNGSQSNFLRSVLFLKVTPMPKWQWAVKTGLSDARPVRRQKRVASGLRKEITELVSCMPVLEAQSNLLQRFQEFWPAYWGLSGTLTFMSTISSYLQTETAHWRGVVACSFSWPIQLYRTAYLRMIQSYLEGQWLQAWWSSVLVLQVGRWFEMAIQLENWMKV